MKLYAGVDGGGTRTRAVIVDEHGRIVARGDAPGAVVTAHDPEPAADAVSRAIGDAMEAAALELLTRDAGLAGIGLPLDGLWAGLAGAGSAEASRAIADALASRGLATALRVGTDVRAAYHDAFPEGGGILLIAGTGSIAWGTDAEGRSVQVGGWGQHLGDEGSGYWIGLSGLRHVMREHDGRAEPGAMTAELLRAIRAERAESVVEWVGSAEKRDIAALAPAVVTAAERGDPAGRAIVDGAVESLVELVRAVGERSAMAPARPEVVLWGGLLAEGGPLHDKVRDALTKAGWSVSPRALDPALGAARLALRG